VGTYVSTDSGAKHTNRVKHDTGLCHISEIKPQPEKHHSPAAKLLKEITGVERHDSSLHLSLMNLRFKDSL